MPQIVDALDCGDLPWTATFGAVDSDTGEITTTTVGCTSLFVDQLKTIFDRIDEPAVGSISPSQFISALRRLSPPELKHDMKLQLQVFEQVNRSGSGFISRQEFIDALIHVRTPVFRIWMKNQLKFIGYELDPAVASTSPASMV